MAKYSGIIDSYAYYYPMNMHDAATPPIPSFDAVLPNEDVWCHVDEKTDEESREWSPSMCTSDSVEASDMAAASDLLLKRHRYKWPTRVGDWELQRVRHEVVMDEADAAV